MTRFDHLKLQRLRTELGLTQAQAAESVGVDERTWRRFESGAVNGPNGFSVRHARRRALLAAICAEFGLDTIEDLLHTPTAGHQLPPARHFVGRQPQLEWLARWTPDAPHRVVSIVGLGGAGKTSLAQRVPADFTWSFYEGPAVDTFFDALADRYAAPRQDRVGALCRTLAQSSDLLVLDGFEVVQSPGDPRRAYGESTDAGLRRLLRAVVQAQGARLLVTSRLPLADLEPWPDRHHAIQLGPLEQSASTALFAHYLGSESNASKAWDRFGGHALSLATVAALARDLFAGSLDAALATPPAYAAADTPLARRLAAVLSTYRDRLAPDERAALALVAHFPRGATVELLRLAAVDDPALANATLPRTLARLARMELVHRAQDRFQAHPFVRDVVRDWAHHDAPTLHANLSTRLAANLDTAPGAAPTTPDALDRAEALVEHVRLAGHLAEAFTLYDTTLGGFPHLGLHLGAFRRGLRILSAFAPAGPESLPDTLPRPARLRLLYQWGLYATATGDPQQALRCYAAQRALGDDRVHQVTARAQAYTLRLMSDRETARDFAEAALHAATRTQDPHALYTGRGLRALIAHEQGEHDLAAAETTDLFADHRPVARMGIWRAMHLADIGEHAAAIDLTQANRRTCLARGWLGHVAHCDLLLGEWSADGRAELAAAARWVERSDEAEMALHTQRLACVVARRNGSPPPIEALRERALADHLTWVLGSFAGHPAIDV